MLVPRLGWHLPHSDHLLHHYWTVHGRGSVGIDPHEPHLDHPRLLLHNRPRGDTLYCGGEKIDLLSSFLSIMSASTGGEREREREISCVPRPERSIVYLRTTSLMATVEGSRMKWIDRCRVVLYAHCSKTCQASETFTSTNKKATHGSE